MSKYCKAGRKIIEDMDGHEEETIFCVKCGHVVLILNLEYWDKEQNKIMAANHRASARLSLSYRECVRKIE